ncbi:SDR family oxidoreductase [uncultured Ferrovibrio sp.]|jgi:NAD(P)-dependent dehydrogenase (short-subunit alcohol dehydrogenase family)|uniref:SDR family oxidoreductase n=1 Tax=uncultured Ferrovibrio sp. TaxID=1576913 RepID=UPI00260B8C44|nr:SDR family oxidoreductase [uncultured Ferrovibrio sp.]
MTLQGRILVITGAGRGLGRSFAEACAKAGAAAIVVADINAEWGEATAQVLRERGTDAIFLPVDLGQPQSIEDFSKLVADRYGRVDGLVNNAAIATGIGGKTFEEIDIETWDRVMSVNVRGTWLMVKAMAPLLRKAEDGGRIVNLASDTALWGAPRLLHYVGSKGAIIAMTRSLARELGPDNITVNAIAPGLVVVEATEYVPQERHQLYVSGRAMQRQQFPEDVTGAVVFLLSASAGFVTGQLLPVNGGFVFN